MAWRSIRVVAASLAAMCSLGSESALAQSRTVSFEEAVRIALERNPTLRRVQVEADLTGVDVSEARMRFLPDLGMGGRGLQTSGRMFNETEGRVVDQTTRSLRMGVASDLTLFNGFRDVANLRRAHFARKAADLDVDRMQESVMFAVAADFLELVNLQEQSRVQRENLAAEMQLEQQIQQYVEAGARAAADLYQQKANVAAARVDLIEAQSAAELAQVALLRTLQLDPAGVYDFQPRAAVDDLDTPPDLQELMARALGNRSDLYAQQARLRAAEQGVSMANASYWPTLELEADYGSAYTDASPLSFNRQLDEQSGGGVTLRLEIPLFDRKAARNASRRAQLQARSARIELENSHQEIGLEVRQAYLRYQAARERFTAAEAQQAAAEKALQTAQERFKAGAATLVELSQARAGFVEAAGVLANARSILGFQRTALDYSVGDLDPNQFMAK